MVFIVSTLFLFAISLSTLAIFATAAKSAPRIIEVIESRGIAEKRSRIVHIGTLRSTFSVIDTPVSAITTFAAPRLVVSNKAGQIDRSNTTGTALPLAA
jgi:hypothetical protein